MNNSPSATNLNFKFMFISSLNFWISDCGSDPGERMNTNGASGEDCEKIRWKSSTGGCTNFSPRASTTNNLTALYTRSDGREREREGEREREWK